jgi:hypothetical protein
MQAGRAWARSTSTCIVVCTAVTMRTAHSTLCTRFFPSPLAFWVLRCHRHLHAIRVSELAAPHL